MESFVVVSWHINDQQYWMKHMLVSLEAIMQEKQQCTRYYKQDCGGLLCMQTLEIIVTGVISSKELENCRDEMKFPLYCKWLCKTMKNGELILGFLSIYQEK